MKCLIICPYPQGKAGNQRFRFEQYLTYLHENGVETEVVSFWTNNQWPGIYGEMSIGFKVLSTVWAFLKRFFLLFSLPKYNTIFIHREATPIGPPWWEWFAAKVFRKRLIYDFDDAVWLPNSSKANAKLVGRLKNHGKTAKIISWSDNVFAGNSFLAEYALMYCKDVRVVPTTIDLQLHSRELTSSIDSMLTIGWTGTHSTLKQLVPLFPLLDKVHRKYPFRFLLIADETPDRLPKFVEFRKWKKESEIQDLLEIDIGIMPLYDTEWERGKCGFKALQYMALEIPAVVSGVGANLEIVEDGITGFVCEAMTNDNLESYKKWERNITVLLWNAHLRKKFGKRGRNRVREGYSMNRFREKYLRTILASLY